MNFFGLVLLSLSVGLPDVFLMVITSRWSMAFSGFYATIRAASGAVRRSEARKA